MTSMGSMESTFSSQHQCLGLAMLSLTLGRVPAWPWVSEVKLDPLFAQVLYDYVCVCMCVYVCVSCGWWKWGQNLRYLLKFDSFLPQNVCVCVSDIGHWPPQKESTSGKRLHFLHWAMAGPWLRLSRLSRLSHLTDDTWGTWGLDKPQLQDFLSKTTLISSLAAVSAAVSASKKTWI